jgi:hypothetical protein
LSEETKTPFDLMLKFLDFKGIFIIYLYLMEYQIVPSLNSNNKKTIVKIHKFPLTLGLVFFAFKGIQVISLYNQDRKRIT